MISPTGAIDRYLPDPEVSSRHAIWIDAAPGVVEEALRTADFSRIGIVRMLMAIRAVPAVLRDPSGAWRRWRASRPAGSSRGLLGMSFTVLADTPEQLLLGLQGRFWTPTGGLVATDVKAFDHGPPPGMAQAVWSFHLEEVDGGTRLTTETRVRTGDPASSRSFRRYWRVVGPFSGVMRRSILSFLRRTAESTERARKVEKSSLPVS